MNFKTNSIFEKTVIFGILFYLENPFYYSLYVKYAYISRYKINYLSTNLAALQTWGPILLPKSDFCYMNRLIDIDF